MSATVTKASRWTCNECRVSVRWDDGEQKSMPAGWAHADDGALCLKCRRAEAAEAAVEASPKGDRAGRAKLRKAGLIEFEIRRAPENGNNIIARACQSSPVVVAAVRARIEGASQASEAA